jgi:hypothetical protein
LLHLGPHVALADAVALRVAGELAGDKIWRPVPLTVTTWA